MSPSTNILNKNILLQFHMNSELIKKITSVIETCVYIVSLFLIHYKNLCTELRPNSMIPIKPILTTHINVTHILKSIPYTDHIFVV